MIIGGRRILSLVAMVALLVVSGLSSTALAESAKEQARALFKKGNERYDKGDYEAALKLYLKARVLYPSHKIDLNIGGALEKLGRHNEEAAHIDSYLRKAGKEEPETRVRRARRRLEEPKIKLASVLVSCLVRGALVELDGKPQGRTPLDARIYLKPGTHLFVLRKEDYHSDTRELVLTAGEHVKLDVSMRPLPGVAGTQPASQSTSRPVPATRTQLAGTSDITLMKRHRTKTIWAYSALATGLALAATAGVLYGVGRSLGDEAHEQYMNAPSQPQMDLHWEDVEAANTKITIGHVCLGTAVAALGLSLYQFITRPSANRAERITRVEGLMIPSGLGLSVIKRF